MIRSLLGFFVAGYLLRHWMHLNEKKGSASRVPSLKAAARAVDTWEGEGGALPEQPAVPGQREHREVPA